MTTVDPTAPVATSTAEPTLSPAAAAAKKAAELFARAPDQPAAPAPPNPTHTLFTVHVLTPAGIAKARELADIFSLVGNWVEANIPQGREKSITLTHLQDAAFHAKRALAEMPEHQGGVVLGPGDFVPGTTVPPEGRYAPPPAPAEPTGPCKRCGGESKWMCPECAAYFRAADAAAAAEPAKPWDGPRAADGTPLAKPA